MVVLPKANSQISSESVKKESPDLGDKKDFIIYNS